jgi:SAM-dependent methyltransferase
MEKLTKTAWDKAFKKEGKIFVEPQEDMPRIVKFFKESGVRRVLDLGCGSGRHLVYLAKHGFEVYGIDIAKHGIEIAEDWLKKERLKAYLEVDDIYDKLPYNDNFFDAVISTQALYHGKIEDIQRLIKEIERILRPEGLIFITFLKRLSKKDIPKEKLYGIKFIAPRTYTILGGPDQRMPHYIFNKKILREEFKNFKTLDLWIDSRSHYYCLLGRLKKKVWLNNYGLYQISR